MKRKTFNSKWKTCFSFTVVAFIAAVLLIPGTAMAAPNQGTGDIGGINADLSNSNIFSLSSTTLELRKMAFLADGTQLVTGATLPRGTEVQFVIYVDNTTLFPISDVSMQDVLDPAFAYQTGSMKYNNTLSSGASEALIYSTVSAPAASVATDPISDDVASAVGVTIDVGNSVVLTNTQVDVAADSVWSIFFRVLMQ